MCQDVFFCVSVWPSHSESLHESSHRPRHSEILETGLLMPVQEVLCERNKSKQDFITSEMNPA